MLELGIFVPCKHSKSTESFTMYVITCSLLAISLIPLTFRTATLSSSTYYHFGALTLVSSWYVVYWFVLRMPIICPASTSPGLVLVCSPGFRSPIILMSGSGQSPLFSRGCLHECPIKPPTFYCCLLPSFNSSKPSFMRFVPLVCFFSEVFCSCSITEPRGLSKGFDAASLSLARSLTMLAFMPEICRGSPTVPRGGTLLSAVVPHQPLFTSHLLYLVLFSLYFMMFLFCPMLCVCRAPFCNSFSFFAQVGRAGRVVGRLASARCLSRR